MNALFKNKTLVKKYIKIYEDTIDEFLDGISNPIGNEEIKFIELKRNAIWLAKNIQNSKNIRCQISEAKDIQHFKTILTEIS